MEYALDELMSEAHTVVRSWGVLDEAEVHQILRTVEVCCIATNVGVACHVFGSVGSRVSTQKSDIDITIEPANLEDKYVHGKKEHAVEALSNLIPHLIVLGYCVIDKIWQSRVPVLKLLSPNDTEIDLSYNNFFAQKNTLLIEKYARLDEPYVGGLIRLVKHWAKAKGVCGASHGYLSSYAWTLAALFFLQIEYGMPNLQCGSTNYYWPGKERMHYQGLDCVLRHFFYFYSVVFQWGKDVVSIRVGERVTWGCEELVDTAWRWTKVPVLDIEDPFDRCTSAPNSKRRNLSVVMAQDENVIRMREAIKAAKTVMRLSDLFIPVSVKTCDLCGGEDVIEAPDGKWCKPCFRAHQRQQLQLQFLSELEIDKMHEEADRGEDIEGSEDGNANETLEQQETGTVQEEQQQKEEIEGTSTEACDAHCEASSSNDSSQISEELDEGGDEWLEERTDEWGESYKFCLACDKRARTAHLSTPAHEKNVQSWRVSSKPKVQPVEEWLMWVFWHDKGVHEYDMGLRCLLCDKFCTDTDTSIDVHVASKEHQRRIAKYSRYKDEVLRRRDSRIAADKTGIIQTIVSRQTKPLQKESSAESTKTRSPSSETVPDIKSPQEIPDVKAEITETPYVCDKISREGDVEITKFPSQNAIATVFPGAEDNHHVSTDDDDACSVSSCATGFSEVSYASVRLPPAPTHPPPLPPPVVTDYAIHEAPFVSSANPPMEGDKCIVTKPYDGIEKVNEGIQEGYLALNLYDVVTFTDVSDGEPHNRFDKYGYFTHIKSKRRGWAPLSIVSKSRY